MRRVSTRVLPEPAPARMHSGMVVEVTARRCSSFSPSRICSASTGRHPNRARSGSYSSRRRRYADFMLPMRRRGDSSSICIPTGGTSPSAFLAAMVPSSSWAGAVVRRRRRRCASSPALLILGTLIWLAERYIRWISTHFVLTTDRVIYRLGRRRQARHRDPAAAHQHHLLQPADLRAHARPGRPEDRVGQRDRGPGVRGHPQPATRCSTRSTRRWRPTRTAASTSWATASSPSRRRRLRGRGPPAQSVADQIAELHQLCSRRALTDAEFEAKKAELLGRM